MTNSDTSSFDLIVVGSGIAGLSAAVTGAELGLKVALVERAPEGEHGGNTRYTEAYLRMKSMDEVADDFESHFAANAGGYPDPGILQEAALDYSSWSSLMRSMCLADPEVIDAFATAAGPTLRWLETAGVKFDFLPTAFLTTTTTRLTWNGLQHAAGGKGFTNEQMRLMWDIHKQGCATYPEFRSLCAGRGLSRAAESAMWAQHKLCAGARGVRAQRVSCA